MAGIVFIAVGVVVIVTGLCCVTGWVKQFEVWRDCEHE